MKKTKEEANFPEQQPQNMQQPSNPTDSSDMENLMSAIEEMQDAIAQLDSRLNKVENKDVENNEQEVPSMEACGGKMKANEEVHVGGDDEATDFSEDDTKGKATGKAANPANIMQEMVRATKSFLRKMEDLQGVPEAPKGAKTQPIGPDKTSGVPATTQPSNGQSPNFGGFNSDGNHNNKTANAAMSQVNKPSSEYPKTKLTQNSADLEPMAKKPEDEEDDEDDETVGKTKEAEDSDMVASKEPKPLDMTKAAEKLFNKMTNEIATKRQSMVVAKRERLNETKTKFGSFNAKEKVKSIISDYLKR